MLYYGKHYQIFYLTNIIPIFHFIQMLFICKILENIEKEERSTKWVSKIYLPINNPPVFHIQRGMHVFCL